MATYTLSDRRFEYHPFQKHPVDTNSVDSRRDPAHKMDIRGKSSTLLCMYAQVPASNHCTIQAHETDHRCKLHHNKVLDLCMELQHY